MNQPLAGDGQEPRIGWDSHDRLGHAQRDDLGVGHDPFGVFLAFGQEIVSGAEHRNQQQVEVGEHRGSFGSLVRESTADFDLLCYVPFQTATPHSVVELLI